MKVAAVFAAVAVAVWGVAAEEKEFGRRYVLPLDEQIGAYEQPGLENAPAFVLAGNDRLMVLKRKGGALQIRDSRGRVGWVDRRKVVDARHNVMEFVRSTKIVSTFEEPEAIYLLDAQNPVDIPVRISRSFAEELRDNIDRESAMKIVGAQPRPVVIR